jgi:hypothetical protein
MAEGIPPRSNPPCPASITTVENEAPTTEEEIRAQDAKTRRRDATLENIVP